METRTHYHKVGENKRKVSFCILKDLRLTDKSRQKSPYYILYVGKLKTYSAHLYQIVIHLNML